LFCMVMKLANRVLRRIFGPNREVTEG